MKKTIVAVIAMAYVASADTYTWDYSLNDAVMGGTAHGAFTTVEYTPNAGAYKDQKLTVLQYKNGEFAANETPNYWYETGTDVFYNAINSALDGDIALTISGSISHGTSTADRYTTILHVGSNDKGLTLGLQGNTLTLTNANVGSSGISLGTIPLNSDANKSYNMTDFSVTIGKGGLVTYSIGGGDTQTATGTFTANWSATESDNYQYSIGSFLPGDTTKNHYIGRWWGGLGELTVTTTSIPEPTTATLSLLALAGLAARRRRR